MKKTLTVNLNGRVFNIDEDAYELLDNYLRNLRIYFRKEEGSSEIIADFEARIEELFSERVRLGYEVISIDQVEAVIGRMGQPADFGESEVQDNKTQEKYERGGYNQDSIKKKFYRNMDDKMFGGVCSGLSAYFGWDVLPVRIILVILIFATTLWIVPVYLLVWMIVPGAKTAEQKLEMRGEAITLENIGKTVAAETNISEKKNENNGCLTAFLDFFVGVLKVGLVAVGFLIGIPLIFVLIIVLIVLFAVLFGVGGSLVGVPFEIFSNNTSLISFDHPIMATVSAILLVGIPVVALIYGITAYFAKLKPLHKGVKLGSFAIWLIALILFFCSGIHLNARNIPDMVRSWNVTWDDSNHDQVIQGNGLVADRTEALPAFKYLIVEDGLIASIRLVQTEGDSSSMLINGDSNIIDRVVWKEQDGTLRLTAIDGLYLNSKNSIIIRIQTPDIQRIELKSIGDVTVENQLKTDHFSVEMDGAGSFRADSLYCESLETSTEGLGSITVGGTARLARFSTGGAGKVEALEFVADTVYAKVDGVGSIRCNPTKLLEGSVDGIGKITYKTEPLSKNTHFNGMGKIGLE